MGQELRIAIRSLRRSPVFFWSSTLLLGISLAACTVTFSLVDALLLRELPVRGAERLVRIATVRPQVGLRSNFSGRDYADWKAKVKGFADLFAWAEQDFGLEAGGKVERARLHFVTGNFFAALDGGAVVGRVLQAEDAGMDASGLIPVVLSYPYWQRRFGGDSHVVGRVVELGGRKASIVGVSAKGFNGLSAESSPDLRAPMEALVILDPQRKESQIICEVGARLEEGVAAERIRQEAEAVWRGGWRERYGSDPGAGVQFVLEAAGRGVSKMRGEYGKVLWMLMGGVGLLALLVAFNLAGLSAARAAGRREEFALRSALGASRRAMVWGIAAETICVVGTSVLVAAGLAYWAMPKLVELLPPLRDFAAQRQAIALEVAPDGRVFGFGVLLALVAMGIAGLLPAFGVALHEANPFLRSGSRAVEGWKARQALVVLQVALCTVLLCGAGLMLETLRGLGALDPGFAAERMVTFSLHPGLAGYGEADVQKLRERILLRLHELPEAEAVAAAGQGLLRGSGLKMTMAWAGEPGRPEDFLNTSGLNVTADYFEAMRIPLLRGRGLSGASVGGKGPEAVLVNQTFAQRFGGGKDVLGRRFDFVVVNGKPAEAAYEVVGVVGDAKYRSVREPFQPIVYGLLERGNPFLLYVRTRESESGLRGRVERVLAEMDPRLSFGEVRTLREDLQDSLWAERTAAQLAGCFAGIAILVSGAGLYALISYWVVQRRRELGIRVALGARQIDVFQLVFGRGVVLLSLGVLAGLGVAYGIAPALQTMLYGVEARDLRVFAGAAGIACVAAALGVLGPAVAAMRAKATACLRQE